MLNPASYPKALGGVKEKGIKKEEDLLLLYLSAIGKGGESVGCVVWNAKKEEEEE